MRLQRVPVELGKLPALGVSEVLLQRAREESEHSPEGLQWTAAAVASSSPFLGYVGHEDLFYPSCRVDSET